MGALQDLKVGMNVCGRYILNILLYTQECLARVDQRADLVQALRQAYVVVHRCHCSNDSDCHSNNKRLLHPGADTKDILSHYVSTIKCLRIVDPPGVLLFKVADPTRRYLRYVHAKLE
jgi:anaphase-promoting complex subunit 2